MIKRTNNKFIYFIIILSLISITCYVILNRNIKTQFIPDYNLDDFYIMPEKKFGINEYKVSEINEIDMVKTYFNSFIMTFFENPYDGYMLLNKDCKKNKYSSFEKYQNEISNITKNLTTVPTLKDYKKINDKEYLIYIMRDNLNNKYKFKIKAVLEYEVFLL